MRKKIISGIGIVLVFTLILVNVKMIATSSAISFDLQELESQACEVFPEGWGTVLLLEFGICDLSNGNPVYGCYDANSNCY